jgi:hypothetical protein
MELIKKMQIEIGSWEYLHMCKEELVPQRGAEGEDWRKPKKSVAVKNTDKDGNDGDGVVEIHSDKDIELSQRSNV